MKVMVLTAEAIARVNYLSRGKTLVLLVQNKYGKNIREETQLNHGKEICGQLAIEHTENNCTVSFTVNEDSTVQYEDGANLDVVNDVTGVEKPYKDYVDEWNVGMLEDLGKVVDSRGW